MKVEGNTIIITAKQEIQEVGGVRTRVFEQKFSLPSGVKAELVKSSLTREGMLVITAPRGNPAAAQSYTESVENKMNKVMDPSNWDREVNRKKDSLFDDGKDLRKKDSFFDDNKEIRKKDSFFDDSRMTREFDERRKDFFDDFNKDSIFDKRRDSAFDDMRRDSNSFGSALNSTMSFTSTSSSQYRIKKALDRKQAYSSTICDGIKLWWSGPCFFAFDVFSC